MTKRKLKKGFIKKVVLIKKANLFSKHFQTTFSCSLKQKHIEHELNEAKKQVEGRKSKKKKILNSILLIVNFCIIAGIFIHYFAVNKTVSFSEFFSLDIDWTFIVLAFVSFFILLFFESLKFAQLIKRCTGKFKYGLALKTHLQGRYYDNITPLAAGGQPFQVFYLNKRGIKGEHATSIPFVKHIFTTFAWVFISLVFIIVNFFIPVTNSPLIIIMAILGLLCNGALVTIILLFSISKRTGPVIVIRILKFLNKIKIVKNYQKTFYKVSRFVKKYQKSMRLFSKHFPTILFQSLCAIISILANYAIVYFIYLAFLPINSNIYLLSITHILTCMVLCDMCSSIMPLPGGSGLAEISFNSLFIQWFPANVFTWALLLWRFLTYFIYIILGGALIFGSSIKKLIKNLKEKKQKTEN